MTKTPEICDLLVIGGGPAGLSAAINGASEGLNVKLLDNGGKLGGQARASSLIENYPGFPKGISGDELMNRLVQQVDKFSCDLVTPVTAQTLEQVEDGLLRVVADDYDEFTTRAVLLSIGLSYRRLKAENTAQFQGRGLYYGVPDYVQPNGSVLVIGGANSAGQAAMELAKDPERAVVMAVRGHIEDKMSAYLVERIRKQRNIRVMNGETVSGFYGAGRVEQVEFVSGKRHVFSDVYVFIGAKPRTLWLKNSLELDDHAFVNTWHDVSHYKAERVFPYETSMRGVFAAGDVRSGSTKRIATAIGEGAGALQMVHQHFARSEKD